MNSQTLGGLTSDQKIDKIFRVFGYSIPVAKDGRRLWPTKFKREMAQQMISGKLSITDVQRTCRVSESTAYRWKTKCGQRDKAAGKREDTAFAELKVNEDKPRDAQAQSAIVLKHGDTELQLPVDYSVKQLALLIRMIGEKS